MGFRRTLWTRPGEVGSPGVSGCAGPSFVTLLPHIASASLRDAASAARAASQSRSCERRTSVGRAAAASAELGWRSVQEVELRSE